MKEPFEMKDLEERLKAKGLTEVERLAEIVAEEVFAWAEESCSIHPNVFVKAVGLPAVGMLKPLAMGAIDKIDGMPG